MSRRHNKNKADEPLTGQQRAVKVKRQTKRYNRVEALHSLDYFVKEIAQELQTNMSLSTEKKLQF